MSDPTFSRIEIKLETRDDLEVARRELLDLAAELRRVKNGQPDDEAAIVLARHHIKRTSQKLRNG